MAIPFYIIDGYNLLHAAGLGRARYGPGDLERCRNRLLSLLRTHLAAAERARTTVVFDAGDAPPDRPRRLALEGMTILFAARGGDADAEIEQLIAAHSAPRRIRVISSDHRLHKAARRRRATATDCETFLSRLERRGPVSDERRDPSDQRRNQPKYGGAVSPIETEHWLRVFGDAMPTAESAGEPDMGLESDSTAATDYAGPATSRSQPERRPDAEPSPAEAVAPDELAFWQARVEELKRESVDRGGSEPENSG